MLPILPRKFIVITAALLLLSGAGMAQGPRLADFANFTDIRAAQVSPDGSQIMCLTAKADVQANRVTAALWLMPITKGAPKPITLPADAIDKVLWSPGSDRLAVMGSHKAAPAIWLVDAATGQSRLLTQFQRSNHYLAHQGANLCWSPDGARIAYLAADAEPAPKADGPIVVTRQQYKSRTALSDNRPTHIWIVDMNGKTRQLTKGRLDEHSIDWSPQGDEIVFCSNRAKDPDANLNYDLFTVKLDGTMEQLTKTAGSEMAPVFSPDGRHIAFTMTKRAVTTIDSVAEDDHVWVLDRKTGQAREPTAKLDRRCAHVRWDADGKSLCFLARDHGRNRIYRVPIHGGDAVALFDMDGVVSGFSLPGRRAEARKGPDCICVLSTPTQPPEVWTCNLDGSNRKMRTAFNTDEAGKWKFVQPRQVNFKSFDGTPVHGWLLLPNKATAEKKVPLILLVHGGPHSMHAMQFSATQQLMCAHGYALLLLNPRGSSGYGQRFSDGCVNDWGGGDYKDLMAGLDHVLATFPEIDGKRLAVTGGSYGGYMTNWIITHTDRFKAAMTYASLSNLISFYATSLYQDLIHVEFLGEPWDHYEMLWDRSPLKHIKNAKTPTLILHGEADFDVHISQSEELFTALKRRGVETVFVRYPREGHGASEPRHQLDQLERTLAWFDRFLK